MSVASSEKHNRSYYIKWAVSVLLPLVFLIPETSETYTYELKAYLALTCFTILLFAFELLSTLIPTLLLPACYLIFQVVPAATAFQPYTQTVIWMLVGGFVFANALEECGLLNRIAYFFARLCKGSFNRLLYFLYFGCIAIEFVTFGNAWLVVIMLCFGICKSLGYDKPCRESLLLMVVAQLGAASFSNFIYTPVTWGIIGQGAASVIEGYMLPWYQEIVYGFPTLLIALITIWVFTKILKTKNLEIKGGNERLDSEYKKMGTMSVKERKGSVLALVLIIYLLTNPLHGLSTDYGFMIIPLLCFFPGINIATSESLNKIGLNLIAFIATCMSIGQVGAAVGAGTLISNFLAPVLANFSPILLAFACVIIGIVVNFFMTPAGMDALLSPIIAELSLSMGIANPVAFLMSLMFVNDLILLPYENSETLVIFSLGLITMKDFIKFNALKITIFIVLYWILVIPYWLLIGIL